MSKHLGVTIKGLFLLPAILLLLQSAAIAEPKLFPGFMFIENAYLERPAAGADQANAYFTITNLHPSDPLVILKVTDSNFGDASLYDEQNTELEQVVINPGETVRGIHAVMSGIDPSTSVGNDVGYSMLIRRGLEAMDPVDAIVSDAGPFSGGIKAREAGIPNEDEYSMSFDVRD